MTPAKPSINREASMLRLTRPLAFIDLESTGIFPDVDRIVEIAVLRVERDGGETSFNTLVNPECRIPKEATAIHGITNAAVAAKPTFAALAPKLIRLTRKADLAGFNIAGFDLKLLKAEFRRAKVDFSLDEHDVVDAKAIFHKKEPRDLVAAVSFYCGVGHEGAHSALSDAAACRDVLFSQLKLYPDLPKTVPALAAYCLEQGKRYIDRDRWFEQRDGLPSFAKGKYRGRTLSAVGADDPEYLDWILSLDDVPEDTKQIIRPPEPNRPRGRQLHPPQRRS